MTQTGHRIKWDHFDILATGQSDIHCKIKETVTSEDVCWSIRNVKFLNESFYNMRCVVMFITAVCLIYHPSWNQRDSIKFPTPNE